MNENLPGDAREMRDLIDGRKRRVSREYRLPVVWLCTVWSVAWLVGFVALYLAQLGLFDPVVAGVVFGVLIAGSIVASAMTGSRSGGGVRADSPFAGTGYGVSWSVCSAAFALLGIGMIVQGMAGDFAGPDLLLMAVAGGVIFGAGAVVTLRTVRAPGSRRR